MKITSRPVNIEKKLDFSSNCEAMLEYWPMVVAAGFGCMMK